MKRYAVLLACMYMSVFSMDDSSPSSNDRTPDQRTLNNALFKLSQSAIHSDAKKPTMHLLLNTKASTNTESKMGKSALWWVLKQDDFSDTSANSCVQLLLDHKAHTVTSKGLPCLLVAVQNNKPSSVQTLVDAKADVNYQNSPKYPLALTTLIRNSTLTNSQVTDVARILLSSETIDVEAQHNYIHGSALHHARAHKRWDLISLLYQHGARPTCEKCDRPEAEVHCDDAEPKVLLYYHRCWKAEVKKNVPAEFVNTTTTGKEPTGIINIMLDYLFYNEPLPKSHIAMRTLASRSSQP